MTFVAHLPGRTNSRFLNGPLRSREIMNNVERLWSKESANLSKVTYEIYGPRSYLSPRWLIFDKSVVRR